MKAPQSIAICEKVVWIWEKRQKVGDVCFLLIALWISFYLGYLLVKKEKWKKKKNHFTVIASLLDYAHIYTS